MLRIASAQGCVKLRAVGEALDWHSTWTARAAPGSKGPDAMFSGRQRVAEIFWPGGAMRLSNVIVPATICSATPVSCRL